MKRARPFAVLSIAVATLVLLPSPASAKKDFLDRFKTYFGLSEAVGKCVYCHAVKEKEKPSKKNLGSYGRDLQAAFASSDELKIRLELGAAKIFERDSDGDGVLNREEMALGTFPGDPESVPKKEALEKYRKQAEEVEKKAKRK